MARRADSARKLAGVGSNELQRLAQTDRAFADTVQGERPVAPASPAAVDSQPAPDSDIGLAFGTEGEAGVAEQPTLSHIGRYALKRLLGEGGLGCVYEAWDPLLSRTVAVKTLQFELDMPSRIALDRLLLNEARAAANLSHANIVTIHDAGLSAHGVYIAMERLRGRDLRQLLAGGWRPGPEAAAQIVRRVADALAYAHARGIVHCDIKPGNIFLTRRNRPKVLDFGIARIAHATALPQGEAVIAGSPHYLAPEQLAGGPVDARCDIYALGVVLYELLAGRKAFRGDSLEQIHAAVRAGQVTPLQDVQPETPRALVEIVERAMALEPDRRFASAGELAQALRQWATTAAAAAAAHAPDAAAATAATESPHPGRARIRGAVAALSVAGVAVIGVLLGAQNGPGEPRGRSAPVAAIPAATAGPATGSPSVAAATLAAPVPGATAAAAPAGPAPGTKVAARTSAPGARTEPATVTPAGAAAPSSGTLQIAVSPWGEVEVDGRPAGTTPPLTQLNLPVGSHVVTIRNADFPPHSATVQVQADQPVTVRHRFGS